MMETGGKSCWGGEGIREYLQVGGGTAFLLRLRKCEDGFRYTRSGIKESERLRSSSLNPAAKKGTCEGSPREIGDFLRLVLAAEVCIDSLRSLCRSGFEGPRWLLPFIFLFPKMYGHYRHFKRPVQFYRPVFFSEFN